MWDIAKNGFTMKDSTAIIAGTVVIAGGKVTLRVSGSNDLLQLLPDSSAPSANSLVGKTIVVDGTIPEAGKGRASTASRFLSPMCAGQSWRGWTVPQE